MKKQVLLYQLYLGYDWPRCARICACAGYTPGVYMPCAGTNIQAYGSHLIELERLVIEAQGAGLVCIAGDFMLILVCLMV